MDKHNMDGHHQGSKRGISEKQAATTYHADKSGSTGKAHNMGGKSNGKGSKKGY